MKITKRQLSRIIKQERAKLYEGCGGDVMEPVGHIDAIAPVAPETGLATHLAESESPEAELVLEMQDALSGLQVVVESLDVAADLCTNCVQEVAAQAPVLQAVATQALALQEMLEAQVEVVVENADVTAAAPASEPMALPQELASEVQLERRKIRRALKSYRR